MPRQAPTGFSVIRLNHLSANAWAVVERPSGAIALDENGGLIIRLAESEARSVAAAMTETLRDHRAKKSEPAASGDEAGDCVSGAKISQQIPIRQVS